MLDLESEVHEIPGFYSHWGQHFVTGYFSHSKASDANCQFRLVCETSDCECYSLVSISLHSVQVTRFVKAPGAKKTEIQAEVWQLICALPDKLKSASQQVSIRLITR